MRVSVYKEEEGTFALLLQAAPGKGKPPVLVQGLTRVGAKESTLALVEEMRGPRVPK